jgi:molybdopterin-guanine dinucleotide biosynthesis protein B
MDSEGRDTWWHSNAGANPVLCISEVETAVIYKRALSNFSLRELQGYALQGTDLVLLEGFSRWIQKESSVAKVVMVRNNLDCKEYLRGVKGQLLCICSYSPPSMFDAEMAVLNARSDMDAIVKKVMDFVEDEKITYSVLNELPGLNCSKCGYESCLDLARAIRSGKASMDNCVPLSLKPKLMSKVVVNEKEVPAQAFVSEIIRRAILGMLSSLKGVEINGNEFVEVRVSTHR